MEENINNEKVFGININEEIPAYRKSVHNQGYYAMIGGELTKGDIVGVHITKEGTEPIFTENGNEHTLPVGAPIYESVEDYQKGEPYKFYHTRIDNIMRWMGGSDGNYTIGKEQPYPLSYWMLKRGVPTEITLVVEDIVIRYDGGVQINGETLPLNIYAAEKDLREYNDLVVNEDGNRRTIKSKKATALPTKEQIAVLENFVDAVKKATDSGLILGLDDDSNLVAVNGNNIKKWYCDCDSGENVIDRIQSGLTHFQLPNNFFYFGDSSVVVEKWADDNE